MYEGHFNIVDVIVIVIVADSQGGSTNTCYEMNQRTNYGDKKGSIIESRGSLSPETFWNLFMQIVVFSATWFTKVMH